MNKPILFSAPMIRALLDGRKTQTRRAMNPQPVALGGKCWHVEGSGGGYFGVPSWHMGDVAPNYLRIASGDRLWVRETCRAEELSRPQETRKATRKERELLRRTEVVVHNDLDGADGVRYLADDHWQRIENSFEAGERWIDLFHYRGRPSGNCGHTVPAIHMPRWASRLTLIVTDVRVQRLQEISEADAEAEGAEPILVPPDGGSCPHIEGFSALWDTINGPGAWDANPWVAAYTFTVHRCNIDALTQGDRP
jgi:hypothetical protein